MTADNFRVVDVNELSELALWLQAWAEWPHNDVWAHPHYVRLFVADGARARCALYSDGEGGQVAYPFLHRVIPCRDYNGEFSDITSVYGYSGPSFWGSADSSVLAGKFWKAFDAWASGEGIVSEFIRFRLGGANFYPGSVVNRQTNYVARLDLDEASLLRSFEPKVRKNLRRATDSGVEVVVDECGDRLDEFLDIYYKTMDRRDAAKMYYFDRSFFEQILLDLPGSFAYFHAVSGSRVISTELVLVSTDSVTSFLGGTESEFYHLRPNDMLKVHIMQWAQERGKREFILGGGAVPGDGIERYKKSFAPEGAVTFQTGQRTLLNDVSHALVHERRLEEAARGRGWPAHVDYFPEYRLSL